MTERIVVGKAPSRIAFCVDDHNILRQVGFGPDVSDEPLPFAASLYPLAYPTFGEDPFEAPALRVTNAGGALMTRLTYREHTVSPSERGDHLTITLVDDAQPLTVRLHVRSFDDEAVLEQWVDVTNDQAKPVVLHEVAAAAPLFAGTDLRLDHFTGDWGAEFQPIHDRLTAGTKVICARATTRPAHEVPPYVRFSPDGPASETSGTVLAASLAWGGNFQMAFDVRRPGTVRAWLGHLPTGAEYLLDPGAVFTTPAVLWAWSDEGTRSLTHRLHSWVRSNAVRDGDRDRAIVVNNWEATGFNFDEDRLVAFCGQAAELGGEIFLLDDGWFGVDYPRVDDNAGLGDWTPNPDRLPNGLAPVGEAASRAGIRFGAWIEPEMVNPASRLYHDHPDWVVSELGRERREERNQLQLNLCHPEVADHVQHVADSVLEPANQVTYLKWDANRMITEPGSNAHPPDRQGHWPVDVVRATWSVMEAIARKHPDVEMMLCASGGGRIDLGTLRYFHEVWLSDNTDPVDRVRMQWHAAEFLPVNTLASHVTRWGQRPIAFACAVAMSARFGFDINTQWLDDDEMRTCQRASAQYKRLRPVIQRGDLYRIVSPEFGPVGALAFHDQDDDRTVAFAFRLPDRSVDTDAPPHRMTFDFLHAKTVYQVQPINLTDDATVAPQHMRGAELLSGGLDLELHEACIAHIWEITRSDQRNAL